MQLSYVKVIGKIKMPKKHFPSVWWLFSSTNFCLCGVFALKPEASWQYPVFTEPLGRSWTARSLSSTSSREWDPTVQLPRALKIALNFPSLCMCSLELQPCWMSQLFRDDIAAEIRPRFCKEKSKDPLALTYSTGNI